MNVDAAAGAARNYRARDPNDNGRPPPVPSRPRPPVFRLFNARKFFLANTGWTVKLSALFVRSSRRVTVAAFAIVTYGVRTIFSFLGSSPRGGLKLNTKRRARVQCWQHNACGARPWAAAPAEPRAGTYRFVRTSPLRRPVDETFRRPNTPVRAA